MRVRGCGRIRGSAHRLSKASPHAGDVSHTCVRLPRGRVCPAVNPVNLDYHHVRAR